jgi:hypothetical protein
MGVDIIAISKAKLVACRGDEECDDSHYVVGSSPSRRDGLKPGCYIVGKGGGSMGFRAGSYAGYSGWKRQLSLLALGLTPEEVWEQPRRFRGKPFVELIDLPDVVGPIIGSKTSAKLYTDFAAFASRARRHYVTRAADTTSSARANSLPTDIVAGGPARRHPSARRVKRHINQAGLSAAEELVGALGGTLVGAGEGEDMGWMWEVYRNFRRAFKLASDSGFVAFG